MATVLSNSTTYTGKDLDGFYTTALLTGTSKSTFRLFPNVKSSVKVGSLNLGNILADDSCSFAATGTITLAQKTLSVCPLKVNLELCEKDYESIYLSEKMRPGSNVDGNIPADFNEFLLNLVSARISQQTEVIAWAGDDSASPVTLCDGIIKGLLADATVIDVAATSTNIGVAGTCIAEITKIYTAIPSTLDISKLVLYVSPVVARAYKQALVTANPALVGWNQGSYELTYIDLKIVVAEGMPTYRAVCADPMNLWYATDLVSDETELNIISMKGILGEPTVRMITEFKIGFGFGVGAEIVLYS
jgi:hypothetical protein